MPILKIVAACEKVIYDQDGPVSLISIFEAMKFRLQEAPLPDRAVAPNQWSVFTLWQPEPEETNQPFTQVIRITAPDGSLFLENEHTFMSPDPDRLQMRIKLTVKSLPIWQEGQVKIKVFLKGDDTERGCTAFKIVYLPKDDDNKAYQPAVT